jgi:cytochrome c oxidase subunit 3
VLLLSSGALITYSHHSIIQGKREGGLYGSILTVLLAIIFTGFQATEYSVASFTIGDGVFGSSFYFATGFHGLHVIVGTIFLGVAL